MSGQAWNESQVYEIRFKGHLSPYRAPMFAGLEMIREPGGETILTGLVLDQAALHGILNSIRDLGVPLISVTQLSTDDVQNEGRVSK